MKVNGVDIRAYNARQLTVDIQPPNLATDVEWTSGEYLPQEIETNVTFGTLKLEVYFHGKARNDVVRNVSDFLQQFTASSVLELDGYQGYYRGYVVSNTLNKTIKKNRYTVALEFRGYLFDTEVQRTYNGTQRIELHLLGTREAPCAIEITPTENMNSLVIDGFGTDSVIIASLRIGHTVILNGMTGTVTEDGANKFSDTELWQFPFLRRGKNTIILSSDRCQVCIRYVPMWL